MNPQILPVLDEITDVLKKHDMAGLIIVGNKTHCDWRMEVSPSWSCSRIESNDANGFTLRVRAKRDEFSTAEAQKQCVEATVGTFVTFGHTLRKLDEQLDTLLAAIATQVNFIGKSTDE